MKKLLLSSLFLFNSFAILAQEAISFEESESYTLNEIIGQNGWTSYNEFDTTLAHVVAANPSQGSNSLEIVSDASNWEELAGVATPTIEGLGNAFEVSFDFYAVSNAASTHVLVGLEEEITPSYFLAFNALGKILVSDGEPEVPFHEVGDYLADQWYNVRIAIDYDAQTLVYYIDDEEVFAGITFGGSNTLGSMVFAFNNFGSGFNIDNIQVSTVLGAHTPAQNSFKVYPNPAQNFVTVSSDAAAIESIDLFDLNGRSIRRLKPAAKQSNVEMADLQDGVYLAKVSTASETNTIRVVKH